MAGWLAALKVGDKVVIDHNSWEVVATVSSRLPTMIVAGPYSINPETGALLGSNSFARPYTAHDREERLRTKLVSNIRAVTKHGLRKLGTPTLQKIHALIFYGKDLSDFE